MYACENGHIDVVKFLCLKGADINLMDQFQKTALMCACENGYINIVKFLFYKNSSISLKDITKVSAYDYANTCAKSCAILYRSNIFYYNINPVYKDILGFFEEIKNIYKLIDFNKFYKYCNENNFLNNKSKKIMEIKYISFEHLLYYIYNFIDTCPSNINSNQILINKNNYISIENYGLIQSIFRKYIYSYITFKYYSNNIDNLIAKNLYNLNKIDIKIDGPNKELNTIIELIENDNKIIQNRFSINDNIGANYGGLLRTFFKNSN